MTCQINWKISIQSILNASGGLFIHSSRQSLIAALTVRWWVAANRSNLSRKSGLTFTANCGALNISSVVIINLLVLLQLENGSTGQQIAFWMCSNPSAPRIGQEGMHSSHSCSWLAEGWIELVWCSYWRHPFLVTSNPFLYNPVSGIYLSPITGFALHKYYTSNDFKNDRLCVIKTINVYSYVDLSLYYKRLLARKLQIFYQ